MQHTRLCEMEGGTTVLTPRPLWPRGGIMGQAVQAFPGMGLGLVATRRLERGEVALAVPPAAWRPFSADHALQARCAHGRSRFPKAHALHPRQARWRAAQVHEIAA